MAAKFCARSFLILAALTTALVCASCKNSAQPLHIEVNTVFANASNPFFASGSAVKNGLVCPEGTVEETGSKGDHADFVNPEIMVITVAKTFTCSDGSGIFYVNMIVKVDTTGQDPTTAQWTLIRGTGKYKHLVGSGMLVGILSGDGNSTYDTNDGKVGIVTASTP